MLLILYILIYIYTISFKKERCLLDMKMTIENLKGATILLNHQPSSSITFDPQHSVIDSPPVGRLNMWQTKQSVIIHWQ